MDKLQFPQGVTPGGTLAVIAPSSTIGDDSPDPGLDILRSWGYTLKLYDSVRAHDGYLAGTDELRAHDVNAAFADDDVDAIICLRGGYGAMRILPLLDYEMIAAHPKLFIGYSDVTALHTALRQKSHLATIHASMVMSLARKPSTFTLQQMQQGLQDPWSFVGGDVSSTQIQKEKPSVTLRATAPLNGSQVPLRTLVPGVASGPLVGGNLSLVAATMGTPYALDGTDGILFIEDVGEEAYAIDRKLCQLELSGLIDRVAGLVFGEFERCEPTEPAPYEWTVEDVITAYAKKWGKPAVAGLPAGHGENNTWLPLGLPVHLKGEIHG